MRKAGPVWGSIGALLVATALTAPAMAQQDADVTAQILQEWMAAPQNRNDEAWLAEYARLQALGDMFETADDLMAAFTEAYDGGAPIDIANAPDWSGVYTRTSGGLQFDPDVGRGEPNTVRLNALGQAAVAAKTALIEQTGGEFDPISTCRPPGTPRIVTEPFLHDFAITPDVTYLINEMVNDIRRVYTDGRPHMAPEDAYPTWNGDSVGFWVNNDTLVFSTKYLRDGVYQRGTQPPYSDQVEVVERFHRVPETGNLESDMWVFDPVYLEHPWYTRQSWRELPNDDYLLRLAYWDCVESQNNDIIVTANGTSQFQNFDFLQNDQAVTNDPVVQAAAEDTAAIDVPVADFPTIGPVFQLNGEDAIINRITGIPVNPETGLPVGYHPAE